MECPKCGNPTKVKDSRGYLTQGSLAGIEPYTVKRRRVCTNCGKSINTLEKIIGLDAKGCYE